MAGQAGAGRPDNENGDGGGDGGVVPTGADPVARPEQPPMEDDASGLPDEEAEQLGDFA